MKIIAKNKRASFDFFLMERVEGGLVLQGTEVKVLREGKVNLSEAFVDIDGQGEAWIYHMQIPQYTFGNRANHEESRRRKILLHKSEIQKLLREMKTQKLTIIPTILYFKDSRVKIELALAKGKKLHDKRDSLMKKDAQKQIQRSLKEQ
jgi:SsrA-binding protein